MIKKFALGSLFFLTFLVLVGVRFYRFGSLPKSLNADEASYGYNAYSILKTGRDLYKKTYPLTLKSFGDYKPAGLTYVLVGLLKFLPLSASTIRLPSALAGLLILPVLYLTLELFFHRPKFNLILTLIFAASPWTFSLSRLFFEANVGLFFMAVALYYFFRWQLKNKPLPFWFYLTLALSGYFYQPFRYIAFAILGLVLFLILKKKQKLTFGGFVFFLVLSLPLLFEMFSSVGLKRFFQENYKQDLILSKQVISHRHHCQLVINQPFVCRLIWNRPLLKFTHTTQIIWQLVSPQFLFFDGRDGFQVLPLGYGAYLPLLLIAYFLALISLPKLISKPYFASFSFIFLVSLLPLASVGELSLHRSVFHLYLLFLFFSLGLHTFYSSIKKFIPYFCLLYGLLFGRFLFIYFTDFSFFAHNIWQTNDAALYTFLGKHLDNQTIIIDNSHHLSPPLYFAFFNRLNPQKYQDEVRRSQPNQVGNIFATGLSNFYFTQPTNLQDLLTRYQQHPQQDILYLTPPQSVYSQYALYQDRRPDGSVIMEIYSLKDLYNKLNSTH